MSDEYEAARQVIEKRQHGYCGEYLTCYFWFVSWKSIACGITVHLWDPLNVEIHIPFGFIRVGFTSRGWKEHLREHKDIRGQK